MKLRRLLQVEKLVHEIGPDSIKDIPLITKDELKLIRQIWLDEFHSSILEVTSFDFARSAKTTLDTLGYNFFSKAA